MVRDLGEGSTDEMVLGLLRAEIDSPQCGSDYAKMLDSFGFDRSALIDNGDLTDTYASHVRAIMLSMVRGHGRNILLFHRFPKDVKWRHVSFDRISPPKVCGKPRVLDGVDAGYPLN